MGLNWKPLSLVLNIQNWFCSLYVTTKSSKERIKVSSEMRAMLFKPYLYYFKVCAWVCVCVWICAHKLQAILSHLTWALGTEPRFSVREYTLIKLWASLQMEHRASWAKEKTFQKRCRPIMSSTNSFYRKGIVLLFTQGSFFCT